MEEVQTEIKKILEDPGGLIEQTTHVHIEKNGRHVE